MSQNGVAENIQEIQQEAAGAAARDGWLGQTTLPAAFGRLVLLRRLARGGMGEVYLAATRGIEGAERPCVVKTIRQEHATDKSFRARFLDETRIQAQLTHPGIAQILEAATLDDERPYAVVEYVEGRHLGEVMQRSVQLGVKFGWADAVAVGVAFGDALAHVHERTDDSGRPLEIAHRDLSPQNIMLGYAGDLKLIDFGTAKGENRRCRTVAGIVYAKPGYVAPEVANQIPGGPSADLYAFGVMLWELAAGRRFLQGDPVDHQARVAEGSLRLRPIAAAIGAPARFDEILAELTHPELGRRTPSARRAVSDLLGLLKSAPSLADGDRSVRGRIAHFMQSLYPAEPARSRSDFARRVSEARELLGKAPTTSARAGMPEPSPSPPELDGESEGLLPGTRYRLEQRISEGTMGEVWQAMHVDLGRKVALKILPASLSTSPSSRQRFKAEARALARLSHAGLPKIHDFGIATDGRPFSAMELLEGETLERRLGEGPVAPREAVRLAIEVLEALSVAHAAGIVHRDIAPSNLFVLRDGSLRVLDFGVSTTAVELSDERTREAPLSVGTPEYISPEQAAGADPDQRSDLYALGVVLYEMITGRLPHPLGEGGSPSLAALLTAKITITPPPPSQFVLDPGYPKALDAVVLRLLQRDADKRFEDAGAVIAALRRALAPERARLPRGGTFVGAVVAFAAVLGVGIWSPNFSFSARLPVESASVVGLEPSKHVEATASAPAGSSESEPPASASASAGDGEERPSPHRDELARIEGLLTKGQKIRAHHEMKALLDRAGESPEVLRTLVRTARGVKAWGEALRACRRVIEVDGKSADRVELAKLERITLLGDPRKTLEEVLRSDPENTEARALLDEYRRDKRLAAK